MHSTVSDGTDTPEVLLEKVRALGLQCFALTDHDDVKGCDRIRRILKEGDPRLINGAEFSCRDELGRYHILGYDFDPAHPAIQGLVTEAHGLRMHKVTARLSFIEEKFGFTFPRGEIDRLLALDNPGKPHIANLMVKYGYAQNKEVAILDYLNQARIRSEYIRPERAIQGVLEGGGIPVLAHPAFGSGEELILGEEMDQRLKRLIGFGLKGLEAFYSGFTAKLHLEAMFFAEKYRLYVTAGSDYHGRNKLVELGETGLNRAAIIPHGLRRFLEDTNHG